MSAVQNPAPLPGPAVSAGAEMSFDVGIFKAYLSSLLLPSAYLLFYAMPLLITHESCLPEPKTSKTASSLTPALTKKFRDLRLMCPVAVFISPRRPSRTRTMKVSWPI